MCDVATGVIILQRIKPDYALIYEYLRAAQLLDNKTREVRWPI